MAHGFYEWKTEQVRSAGGDYPGIDTPGDLYDALTKIWSADTCAPRMRQDWRPDRPALGQCSITAFLAQDLFGGKVRGIALGDGNFHCYNQVGEARFDLTSEQFGEETLDYRCDDPEQDREIHFSKAEKRARYEHLKQALARATGKDRR